MKNNYSREKIPVGLNEILDFVPSIPIERERERKKKRISTGTKIKNAYHLQIFSTRIFQKTRKLYPRDTSAEKLTHIWVKFF